jgi:hypothetical protein
MILSQRKSDELVRVHYDSARSSSTSTTPDPEDVARVYDLQLRRERERTTIDWEAEAANWGEETRTWVEEVQQAGDEALLGDLSTDE